jgi:hypothetical protein
MKALLASILILCSSLWVAAQAPSVDEKALLAIHESARQAHLTGDADLLVASTAESFIDASRGVFTRSTRADSRRRFREYFKVAKYSVWADTQPPKVEVSGDGTLAWMAVSIHAELTVAQRDGSGRTPRSFESSWIATYRKFDGQWKMVGISSNVVEAK